MIAVADHRRVMWTAVGAGVAFGVVYTLSPLTTLSLGLVAAMSAWASRGLSSRERRWFYALLAVAVLLRLAIVAGLFLSADRAEPFAALFGDEQFFKNRAVWMRNIGMGVPVSAADFIYAFEDTGQTSYLYMLAFIQALVGEAPYGVHVLNAGLYVTGVLMIYRLVRPAFGSVAAMAGFSTLLFFPSLLVWSISALKEPTYTLVAMGELACAVVVARDPKWWHRTLGGIGIIVGVVALESLRRGGGGMALVGVTVGLLGGFMATRPRWLVAGLVAVPLIGGLVLVTPAAQDRLLGLARDSAFYHAGHVVSSGYSYKILDERYYRDRGLISDMPAREAAVYVGRSIVSYVTEPVPWRSESMAMRVYLPEQVVWMVVLALSPIGLVAGFRRDAMLTSLLAAHAAAVMMMVALTSGNIGTLIRHRGLALPYLAWLAGLGAYECVRAMTRRPRLDLEG